MLEKPKLICQTWIFVFIFTFTLLRPPAFDKSNAIFVESKSSIKWTYYLMITEKLFSKSYIENIIIFNIIIWDTFNFYKNSHITIGILNNKCNFYLNPFW